MKEEFISTPQVIGWDASPTEKTYQGLAGLPSPEWTVGEPPYGTKFRWIQLHFDEQSKKITVEVFL